MLNFRVYLKYLCEFFWKKHTNKSKYINEKLVFFYLC